MHQYLQPLENARTWRDARSAAAATGWELVGTGDWAWVFASPDGRLAWRVTPFDPAFDYFAATCAQGHNPHLPRIAAHHHHEVGGTSVVMERLDPIEPALATGWTTTFTRNPDPGTAKMLEILDAAVERCDIPLFRGLDINPGNVRLRPVTGELVLIDGFWMDGEALFELAVRNPTEAIRLLGRRALSAWAHIPAIDEAARSNLLAALDRA